MLKFKRYLWVAALAATGPVAAANTAPDVGDFADVVRNGSVELNLRYRLEHVDQDGMPESALASTLRSRISLATAPLAGFALELELDDVTALGNDRYNSTVNGHGRYPVVADPEGTEVNRAQLDYRRGGLHATAGRQRILHANQRFVGNVGWRQNEQTYDGLRWQWQGGSTTLDGSYVYRVQRVFGPDDGAQSADWDGEIALLRTTWSPLPKHTLAAFAYHLDIDPSRDFSSALTVANASETVGLEYSGEWQALSVTASWASQGDIGDNPGNYRAQYHNLEATLALSALRLQAGHEVLGADNGSGFRTPLATLHKFQGWADMFLVTPGEGLRDSWLGLAGERGSLNWATAYHDFRSDERSRDLGRELDLLLGWKVSPHLSLQFKLALFDAASGSGYRDTDKAWLIAELRL
ncbi:alginate export family protein [Haliea sp. E1-2-M8]|uniref:alginate export family protein n=1 Tax=Haliea sp. E1-2-M8 TaxID=3064706 RepID=UPI0027247224|nr:alginate export family protein [Haliea sp. E1-2-M8]MDO8860474.1 alginate export family protein [Haliea sp. E1-2-M8]